MDSGRKKLMKNHRPQWPEFRDKPVYRSLFLLLGKEIIDENGVSERVSNWQEVVSFMFSNNALLFVPSLVDEEYFPFLFDAVFDDSTSVSCNKRGQPNRVRVKRASQTRWIVTSSSWGVDFPEDDFLRNMRDMYNYIGVGTKPTPSSTGHTIMRITNYQNLQNRHTSLSLACECYIRDNGFGGVVQTPGIGNSYPELLSMDKYMAYLGHWTVHPEGAGVNFRGNTSADKYSTWFAECQVDIRSELALGPFPTRQSRKSKVVYPTLEGRYHTYMWKEQADKCIQLGCDVKVISGYGWRSMTDSQQYYSQRMYELRKGAISEFVEKRCKQIAVSGIGHHAMGREQFVLVPEGRESEKDPPVVDSEGRPLNIFISTVYDTTSALMTHYHNYTVSMCNLEVISFGLPYAEQSRLVAMDYDSVLVIEKDERHKYIARKSIESRELPPGTWLWELLTNVKITSPRGFDSDQKIKSPGAKNGKKYTGPRVMQNKRRSTVGN